MGHLAWHGGKGGMDPQNHLGLCWGLDTGQLFGSSQGYSKVSVTTHISQLKRWKSS